MGTAKNKKTGESGLKSTSQVITSINYKGEEIPFSVSTKAVFAMEIELGKSLQEIIVGYNMKHALIAIRECIKSGYQNRSMPDKASTINDELVLDIIDEVPGTYNNAYLTLDLAWQKFHNIQTMGN